ncbi:hypothetical protein P5673_025010 [Acropora cervicornis]|uniref:DDE Tnp4 domain-containing protein n=1 Tax=Acropora cervicornis TaxID=6130 RepID=A0AAD9Q371_ACRCE|nr:hypothetical protein P5673_025010 [Acropora cervicornis]
MAVCDAHYVFSLVNIGDFRSNNDSGVLQNSAMGRALEHNTLGIPDAEPFEGIQNPLPYFLVGDTIFGLETWMQHPFPGHRELENTFGISTARWGIFNHTINASVETPEAITKAAVCLNNFIRLTNSAVYCPSGFVDSEDASGKIKQ